MLFVEIFRRENLGGSALFNQKASTFDDFFLFDYGCHNAFSSSAVDLALFELFVNNPRHQLAKLWVFSPILIRSSSSFFRLDRLHRGSFQAQPFTITILSNDATATSSSKSILLIVTTK